jgi:hypothetical protein
LNPPVFRSSTFADEERSKLMDHVANKPEWFWSLHMSDIVVLEVENTSIGSQKIEVLTTDVNKNERIKYQSFNSHILKVVYVSQSLQLSDLKFINLKNSMTKEATVTFFASENMILPKNYRGMIILQYSNFLLKNGSYRLLAEVPEENRKEMAIKLSKYLDSKTLLSFPGR